MNSASPSPTMLIDDAEISEDSLQCAVDLYFTIFHPWIPMLHLETFRQALANNRKHIMDIIYAMLAVTVKYSTERTRVRLRMTIPQFIEKCRDRILANVWKSGYSLPNVQALIILAFDDILSGQKSEHFVIIDTIIRIVDRLGLRYENDSLVYKPNAGVIKYLAEPKNWVEEEEQRRTFWVAFVLERYCAATAGWNLNWNCNFPNESSFKSEPRNGSDKSLQMQLCPNIISRRLPCSGQLYYKSKPVKCRYFGVSSFGKGEGNNNNDDNISSLGGFAYAIEAIELFSQVVKYYKTVEVNDNRINDFNYLSQRISNWKYQLPNEWRKRGQTTTTSPSNDNDINANINNQKTFDENLTMAHLIHHASLILLYQPKAYPTQSLVDHINLMDPFSPSSQTSAATCIIAAIEIAEIIQEFLATNDGIVHPIVLYCLFLAGRTCLIHAQCHQDLKYAAKCNDIISALIQLNHRCTNSATTMLHPTPTGASHTSLALKMYQYLNHISQNIQSLTQDNINELYNTTKLLYELIH